MVQWYTPVKRVVNLLSFVKHREFLNKLKCPNE